MIKRICVICIGLLFVEVTNAQIFNQIDANGIIKIRHGDVCLGDIDNDGDNDLIVSGSVGSNSSATYIYKNNGNGFFTHFQSSGLPLVDYGSLATGDIDNDGDLDLFVTGDWDFSGNYTEMFINDGTGHFTVVNSSFPQVVLGDSKFFDADNDGDLDLFYFGRTPDWTQISKLFFNDGAGNFVESNQLFPPYINGSLDIGDVNGDNFLDILICGESGWLSNTQLLLNQGDGTFIDNGQSFVANSFGTSKFIDIESDGDLDVVVNGITNGSMNYNSVFYENDGVGGFSDIGNLGLDSLMSNSLITADIDMDGDIDIFLSGSNSNNEDTCAIYLNDGGSFTKDNSFSHQGLYDGAAVFGRMTNDCGIDLFYCGFGDYCSNESYLFRNEYITSIDCPSVVDDSTTIDTLQDVEYTVLSNPFSDIIRINLNTNVYKAFLYDDRGRIVRENYQYDSVILMDARDLLPGIYILKFRTFIGNREFEEKLIKVN